MKNSYLNPAQFNAETEKCLQCKTKPCEQACPAHCSPHDFIAAAKNKNFDEAANMILQQNPLAETCGLICPDKFCMNACLRAKIDNPINIPKVQATILQKYREKFAPQKQNINPNGKKIAVIGAGPAGIGAAATLLKLGYAVSVYEKSPTAGGALNMIPESRLPKNIVTAEWKYLSQYPNFEINLSSDISNPQMLLQQGYDGVICATGENQFRKLGVEGEQYSLNYDEYLLHPQKYVTSGNVAVIGGGAVAVDCAITARETGAKNVEMFVRRRLCDMRITAHERASLLQNMIDITTMTRISKIEKNNNTLTAYTVKTRFNGDGKLEDIPNTQTARPDFAIIVMALGTQSSTPKQPADNIIYAGDCLSGSSTAVQAVAFGKNAARQLHEVLFKN